MCVDNALHNVVKGDEGKHETKHHVKYASIRTKRALDFGPGMESVTIWGCLGSPPPGKPANVEASERWPSKLRAVEQKPA